MNKVDIAKVAHEINKTYCLSIGDSSQLTWDDSQEWQKDSAINGVEFHLKNPDASPASSHNSWLKEKQESGWKYGLVKDVSKKEHPCFVAYDDLPYEQRTKDYLFKQVVDSLKVFLTE